MRRLALPLLGVALTGLSVVLWPALDEKGEPNCRIDRHAASTSLPRCNPPG